MTFVEIPTEQTTAVTDAILGVAAVLASRHIWVLGARKSWRAKLWSSLFALMAIAALLGAAAHGIKMANSVNAGLWIGLNLSLGLMVAVFVAAVVHDLFGEQLSHKILPWLSMVALVFWAVTWLYPDSFLVFILYETVAMMFALGGYLWLGLRGTLPGAWWMIGGVMVSITAALLQATVVVKFRVIWHFDRNGIYHLVQLAGLVLFVIGLRQDLCDASRRNPSSNP